MKKIFHGFHQIQNRVRTIPIFIIISLFAVSCEQKLANNPNFPQKEESQSKSSSVFTKDSVSKVVKSFLIAKHLYLTTFDEDGLKNKENMDNTIKSMIENKKEMIKGLLLFEGDKSHSFFANSTMLRGGGLPNEILALYLIHSLLLEEFFFNRDEKSLNSPIRGHLYNDSFDFIVDTSQVDSICTDVKHFENDPYLWIKDYSEIWAIYKSWISKNNFKDNPIKKTSFVWLRLSMVKNCK